MTFESPLMLSGLFAIGVILWVHFRRRRINSIAFPSMSILMKVVEKKTSRLRLRRLLLLITRILAVTFLVLAMSRPGLFVRRPGGIRAGTAIAQVIVLDDSLSMQQIMRDGKTAFEYAKETALRELGRLRPGDGSSFVLSGRPARKVTGKITYDPTQVTREVEQATPSYRSGDIESALVQAAHMLEDSPLPQREVVLITDLSEKGWAKQGAPWEKSAGINLRVLPILDEEPTLNAAVEFVSVEMFGEGGTREVSILARLANHSARSMKKLEVVLELDGHVVAGGSVDLPANGYAVKKFHHRFEDIGIHRGLVKIKGDKLPNDNIRHFMINVRQTLKALIINGDHRPGSYKDETFYLDKALSTPTPGEVPIQTAVLDVEAASTGPLTGYDVVFLAGVESLPLSLGGRLIQFIKNGGGLFVSPGTSGVNLDLLESVMPATFRSVRRIGRVNKSFRVGAVNRDHPVFHPFGTGATGLEDVRVNAHLLVEPDTGTTRTVIAQFKDGAPFLIERQVEQGIVMLLCTTVDRDWTDLPIRPGYLPLVQRSARYLAGRLSESDTTKLTVGQSIELEVSEGMKRLVILDPTNNETVFSANELAGRTKIKYTDTVAPGTYRIWTEVPEFGGMRELTAAEFVVNIDPAESNLVPDESAKSFVANSKDNSTTKIVSVEGHFPLWPYLLLVGVIFLLIETLLAGLGLRRSHIKSELKPN